MTKPCEACGTAFRTFPSCIKIGKGRFCSTRCSRPYNGAILAKAGEGTRFKLGDVSWSKINAGSYNLHFSEPLARNERIRQSKLGSKSHFWKGGISKERNATGYYRRCYDQRVANAPGFHTVAEWEALKERCNFTCVRCIRREPEILLSRDHIWPLSRGGSDNIDNLQPLCMSCNASKQRKIINYLPLYELTQ